MKKICLLLLTASAFYAGGVSAMKVAEKDELNMFANPLYRAITDTSCLISREDLDKFKKGYRESNFEQKKAIVGVLKGQGSFGELVHCYSSERRFSIFSSIKDEHPDVAGDYPALTGGLLLVLMNNRMPKALSIAIGETKPRVMSSLYSNHKKQIEFAYKMSEKEKKLPRDEDNKSSRKRSKSKVLTKEQQMLKAIAELRKYEKK